MDCNTRTFTIFKHLKSTDTGKIVLFISSEFPRLPIPAYTSNPFEKFVKIKDRG